MGKDFLFVTVVARLGEDCSVVSSSYCRSFLWGVKEPEFELSTYLHIALRSLGLQSQQLTRCDA